MPTLSSLRTGANIARGVLGLYHGRYSDIWVGRSRTHVVICDWMREHTAIFVHVPKAAGSSIKEALGLPEELLPHCPAEGYRKVDSAFYDRAYTFAFVRNPWDRIVSAFHHIKFGPGTEYDLKVREQDMSDTPDFDAFIQKLRRPVFRAKILTRMHFMPQTFYLCATNGDLIVNDVGRFETLDADFARMTERLGIPSRLEHALPSTGRKKDYREHYDAGWKIELVANMYASDIAQFGYTFTSTH